MPVGGSAGADVALALYENLNVVEVLTMARLSRIACLLVSISVACASAGALRAADTPAGETVESIQKKVLALHGKIKSFSGRIDLRFDSTLQGDWVKSNTTSPVEYVFKGDKVLYRIDLKTETVRSTQEGQVKTVEEQTLMSDGEFMYQLGQQNGKKIAFKANIDKLQTSVPSKEFFLWLERDYELTVLPDEKVDGKDCWVIRAAKKTDDEVLKLKTVTYFRKDIPVMVKTVNYDRFDNVMQVTEVKDIKLDVDIKPERFQFKPDPDTQIHDQTW